MDLSLIFSLEPEKPPLPDLPVQDYPLVHQNDQVPVNLIAPSSQGPWIAGGATLQWYQSQELQMHDIDVFCAGPEQADQLCQRLAPYCNVSFQSNNAVTYQLTSCVSRALDAPQKTWSIQVIKRNYFDSVQDVINSFDITVCQIGMDGHTWTLGKMTASDIRQKNLRMTLPLLPDAVKRLTKYWSYGYRPVPGLLKSIAQNPESRWTFDPSEEYNHAF
jgi:hypothetical protein